MHEVQRHHPRPSRYVAPRSIDEALALLAEHGTAARVLAGGTDLLLEIDRGARRGVDLLVDLTRISGLDSIEFVEGGRRDGAPAGDGLAGDGLAGDGRVGGGLLRLGPLVTHNQVVASADAVRHALPLAQACLEVGAPALRNRATVVGNLVTASPANDTISALWAMDATVVLRSLDDERRVKVRELYPGIRRTVLQPTELIVGVEMPVLGDASGIFVKLGQRRSQAISVVHLAAVLRVADGVVASASIALGSVAATIVSASAAEDALLGRPLDAASIADAARLAAAAVTPIGDIRATAAYRSEEVEVMVRRALEALADGSERSTWPARSVLLSATGTTGRGDPRGDGALVDPASVVSCTVNGRPVAADGAVGSNLLDWLRDEVGLTGSKEGCAEGECGACTVHLDRAAVLSCLVPAARADGTTITTIEGLATDEVLHPVQQAFVDQFAVQCGYCIPGFVMAGAQLLGECPSPTRDDIATGLSGNLCRCTGYYRFYEALEQAAGTTGPARRP